MIALVKYGTERAFIVLLAVCGGCHKKPPPAAAKQTITHEFVQLLMRDVPLG